MQWKFWQSPGPRTLPEKVKKALQSQYRLDAPSIEKMRYLSQAGYFAGRPVRFMKLFDPALIKDTPVSSLNFGNFLQKPGHREALLFEGHIEKDGAVYLADRRSSTVASVPVSSPPAAKK